MGCHFCVERLTACMSDVSLGKGAAADKAATESSSKDNHSQMEKYSVFV